MKVQNYRGAPCKLGVLKNNCPKTLHQNNHKTNSSQVNFKGFGIKRILIAGACIGGAYYMHTVGQPKIEKAVNELEATQVYAEKSSQSLDSAITMVRDYGKSNKKAKRALSIFGIDQMEQGLRMRPMDSVSLEKLIPKVPKAIYNPKIRNLSNSRSGLVSMTRIDTAKIKQDLEQNFNVTKIKQGMSEAGQKIENQFKTTKLKQIVHRVRNSLK